MFSSSGSPDGLSSHRSPPYASRTAPTPESPGVSPGVSPGGRLQLVLKSPYKSKVAPAIEKFVDPSPDWSLQDLQSELDVISTRYTSTVSLDNEPPPSTARGISWRELSVTTDFGRTTAPFRMRVFDSDSETESSDDEFNSPASSNLVNGVEVGSDYHIRQATSESSEELHPVVKDDMWEGSPLLARTEYVESALLELERERHSRVQEEFRKRRLLLDNALREEVQREAALLARVEKEKEAKCELARRSDKQDQRQIAELRDEHLSALQRDHELRSQFEARQIRKEAAEEEARRQEIAAREERERQAKAKIQLAKEKAEAEAAKRKAQADAALKREEDQKAKENLQLSTKENDALKKVDDQKGSTSKSTIGLKPKVAPSAVKLEESRLSNLRAYEDVYAPLRANPVQQKELKTYERQIIKHLQQIAATQQQVGIKSRDLLQFLNNSRGVPTQFLLVTLGAKLLSQCESQVLKLPSFAFALAQVVVNVASHVPSLIDIILAKLHEVCIFTVPKYYVFTKDQFENDAAYYKALGYREEDGKLESTDDYVARQAAYMTFYGAMVQTDVAGGENPHGLVAGWAWCARFLNSIPADRNTASALEAFLKMAGFRLYQVYPKPFMRIMQAIVTEYIENLKKTGDADARAVVSRLETFLHLQKYLQEPEGRKMPVTDVSSSLKA